MHSVCSAVKGRKGKEWGKEKLRKRERERRTQVHTQGQETTDAGVMQFEPHSKGTLTH